MYNVTKKTNRLICSGIISFILLSNFNLGQTTDNFPQHSVYKRERACPRNKFRCLSDRTCVDKFVLCDGVKNCADGSDETEALCNKTVCPGFSFRCNYGACIDSKAKCNGHIDCVDASDENNLDCTEPHITTEKSKFCKSNQFQCRSQQCIDQKLVCNGKSDCIDGSDETIQRCEKNKCPQSAFRCLYGGCIDGKFKCDKIKHCVDGSDEFSDTCKNTPSPTVLPNSSKNESLGTCILPQAFQGETFTVECPENLLCNEQPGMKVPKYTVFSFNCSNPGYQFNDSFQSFQSICVNGKWLPEIKKCTRFCKPLKPKNVDLTCYRKNIKVDCDSLMKANTTVQPRCRPYHQVEYPVFYRDISCQEDGEWTNPLFSCIPECGKIYNRVTKLVLNGRTPSKYGDSPWNVAVYEISEQDKTLICAGSIISPQLIVSAAHCFYDDVNQKPENIGKYEIAVSKVTRNHKINDNEFTKFYKIRQIYFSTKGYGGSLTNYAANIVIIQLDKIITLSHDVLPSCVRWTANSVFSPSENASAKIHGWGLNESGNFSETLLTAHIPYISYSNCVKIAESDFKESVTLDKFCAGTETGLGARLANIGSGLFFLDVNTGLYYIRGILSNKDQSGTSIATFTDLAQYVDWINDIKKKVESEIIP